MDEISVGSFNQMSYGGNNANAQGGNATINIYQSGYGVVFIKLINADVLKSAWARLDALPEDVIPEYSSLAVGSRMPYRPNQLFVGRESLLMECASKLKHNPSSVIVFCGVGGMGKTQLVSEIVHRYGSYFAGGVYWINCADSNLIISEVIACWSGVLPYISQMSFSAREQLNLIFSVWQSELPCLLIFDNCEDEETLQKWLPSTGKSRVLVTSRRFQWRCELGIHVVAVRELPRQESIQLLHKYRSDITDEDAIALSAEVGDLPLALHLIGSYLLEYEETRSGNPQIYLQQLRSSNLLMHRSLRQVGTTGSTGHVQNIVYTFEESYRCLLADGMTNSSALRLLTWIAYFAPGELLSVEVLLQALMRQECESEVDAEYQWILVSRRLQDLGLLEHPQRCQYRLHRLLALYVQQQTSGEVGHSATC
jgi:hypothetical protein